MDELDLIAWLPANDEDADDLRDEDVKVRVRARVMATIAASAEATPDQVRPLRRTPRRARGSFATRIVRYGVAAAVAAVTVALIVPVAFTDRPSSSASAALLRLAENASRGSGWEHPTPHQLIYTRSSGQSPVCTGESCVLEPFQRESWIAPDGSGRILETRGGQTSDETFQPGELAFRDLYETLGWNQSRVRRHIEELLGFEDADDFTTFVVIGELMGETQLLADMRVVLFRIAATLADTELLGPSSDALGRHGIGIGYSSGGLRYEVLFDRDTALVLEQRVVETEDDSPPISIDGLAGGWLVAGSRSTYERSGLVASTDERL
jgi:hypothetical protein